MNPDFGAASEDYAQHRAGFPDSFFERLAKFRVGIKGQLIVDLGTGTGSLARGFAKQGCLVIGIDRSDEMLSAAQELDSSVGVVVEYRLAKAEDTGLPGTTYDVVAAGQCWHWFDRPRAAVEVKRLLKPGGIAIIAHFDWVPITGNLVRATEELIESHNPSWSMGDGFGMYPLWLRDLGEAGFKDIETFSYDIDIPYTPEAWRGRIRASAGVGGSMSSGKVGKFDEELAKLMSLHYQETILQIPHRVFAVITQAP